MDNNWDCIRYRLLYVPNLLKEVQYTARVGGNAMVWPSGEVEVVDFRRRQGCDFRVLTQDVICSTVQSTGICVHVYVGWRKTKILRTSCHGYLRNLVVMKPILSCYQRTGTLVVSRDKTVFTPHNSFTPHRQ